jgi:hypothetical protein
MQRKMQRYFLPPRLITDENSCRNLSTFHSCSFHELEKRIVVFDAVRWEQLWVRVFVLRPFNIPCGTPGGHQPVISCAT